MGDNVFSRPHGATGGLQEAVTRATRGRAAAQRAAPAATRGAGLVSVGLLGARTTSQRSSLLESENLLLSRRGRTSGSFDAGLLCGQRKRVAMEYEWCSWRAAAAGSCPVRTRTTHSDLAWRAEEGSLQWCDAWGAWRGFPHCRTNLLFNRPPAQSSSEPLPT